ncbi:MAG: insulinase family protein [Geminicoccaceae bacterium]|nr:insulinase family protein [Geminicoccaceae bacterium]
MAVPPRDRPTDRTRKAGATRPLAVGGAPNAPRARRPRRRAIDGGVLRSGVLAASLWLAATLASAAEPAWPVRAPDLPAPDPRITWGRLENGLRFAIVPNATPPGGASLRLAVAVGSLDEGDDERGLAHLVEHMAFRGSARIPPGALAPLLEREGLAFGADTNARVDFATTVFMVDLPRATPSALDTALFVLAETAGALAFPEAELEAERGVVLAEARLRSGPRQRAFERSLAFRLAGTLVPERLPIGDPEVIRGAPRERLVAFYRRWYRPDRMILAIAGEVDPIDIGARIAARFAALPRPAEPAPEHARRPPAPRGLATTVALEKGLPASLVVSFSRPDVPRADSRARRAEELAELVVEHAFERRLQRIASRPDAPFASASMGTASWPGIAEETILRASIEPARWRDAVAALERELRRLRLYGVLAPERDEALAVRRAALEERLRSAATRGSRALAEALVGAARAGRVLLAPEAELALFDELVPTVDEEALRAAVARLFAGSGPMIELVLPEASGGDEARLSRAVEAAWRESETIAVDPPEPVARVALAYAPAEEPAPIRARTRLEALDVTSATFANGLRLDVKPTRFEAGSVRALIRFGRGRLGLPLDRPGLDGLAEALLAGGGLGRHDAQELARLFAAERVRLGFSIREDACELALETRPEKLATAFALARALLEDPGLRAEALPAWRRRLEAAYRRLETVASAVLEGPVARLVNGGDPRFGLPDRAAAEARTPEEVRAWLRAELAAEPLEVAIVGDVDPERAIDAVARTLALLPAPAGGDPPVPPPAEIPRGSFELAHDGPAEQALLLLYHQTTDARDPRLSLGLDLLAELLDERLRALLRERLGATYAPSVSSSGSLSVPGRGRIAIQLDLPAARVRELRSLLVELVDRLRAEGPSAEELERVLAPRRARIPRILASNGFWLEGVLAGRHRHPQKLERALRLEADLASWTREGLAELARIYLAPERRLEILVLPRVQG